MKRDLGWCPSSTDFRGMLVACFEAWRADGLPTFHNAFPQSFDAL